MKLNRGLLYIALSALTMTGKSYAIDTGNLYRIDPESHRMHIAAVIETEERPHILNSPGIKNAIGSFFEEQDNFSASNYAAADMVGNIKSVNFFFRPTLFLGDQLSIFLDLGLFDDVDATIQPPLFGGGGGRITQEIYEDVHLNLYGNAHVTQLYRYPLYFDLGTIQTVPDEKGETEDMPLGDYQTDIDGRFYMATLGAIVSTRLPLESMEILPYIGGELSLIRGTASLKEIVIPGANQSLLPLVERSQLNFTVTQKEMPFLILGITILRPNNATLRVETKISQSSSALSLGIGVLL